MPTAPRPPAGKLSSTLMVEVMRSSKPRRIRPAAARMMASYSPASSLARRVLTLPRRKRICRSGRRASNWAGGAGWRYRRCCRPAARRGWRSGWRRRHRAGLRARRCSTGPAFGKVHGHVLHRMHGDVGFIVQQGGFQFLDEQALAANLRQRGVEQLVTTADHGHQVTSRPGWACSRRALTYSACHRAKALLRVAMRISRVDMERPDPEKCCR